MPRLLPAALLFALAGPGRADERAALDHFETKVRPLLLAHCANCHGADAKKIKGGLDLTTAAGLRAGGDSGPDPKLIAETVRYAGELKMPPKGKLPAAAIAALEKWVAAGAPWPDAAPAPATKPAGPLFTPEQTAFWAFRPVQDPPVVATAANPIDAFLNAKLAAAGLEPAPPADARTLIRRVHHDLIGLPPTPEEVSAFEQSAIRDPRSAFAEVVDRLLASPHYGERWGRHWLDVARYADSNGLDENTAFANAWRYRDYVVRSFNADKPYHTFLREQIAGDLLPPTAEPAERDDRLTALGYLALGAKLLAEPDKQKMLLDIADEQLDTLGRGVMGLTLGCARCHDHKFDPLPTRDYYSLLGVFTSTRTMQGLGTVAKTFERRLGAPDTPEVAAKRKELEKLKPDLKKIEKEFSKTPATDKAKRGELHTQAEAIRAKIRAIEAAAAPPVAVLSVEEGSDAAYRTRPRNLHVQVRGNYVTAGEEAPPVFLRVLAGENPRPFLASAAGPSVAERKPATIRYGAARPASGRRELAEWLTDGNHPLTARVFVNRVWLHHFGRGLVGTPDNFGRLGERPTHPELLDWLSARFVEDGWSVKQLHQRILLSDAYRRARGVASDADPENRLLAHYPRRRLDAESLRDSMLAVSGRLDRTLGGTLYTGGNFEYVGKVNYETNRRTLYLPVNRNNVYPFLSTFDFPDPSTLCGARASTVVAPQALFLLNSPFVTGQAAALAGRLGAGSPAERVRSAYRLTLQREPDAEEVRAAAAFVADFGAAKGWAALTQALLAGSEFLYGE